MKNPTKLLRDFFDKSLLIKLSTKTIDHTWGENLKTHISKHAFTDPFNVDEQTDPEQVQYFNELMNIKGDTIKWRRLKTSGNQLYIKPENKDDFIPDAISQLYLQLSIPVFENLIVLLKGLLFNCTSWNSFSVINDFYAEFKSELKIWIIKTYRINIQLFFYFTIYAFFEIVLHTQMVVSQILKRSLSNTTNV